MKKVSTVAVKQSTNFGEQKLTIGLDLGDRSSWYCLLDEAGWGPAVAASLLPFSGELNLQMCSLTSGLKLSHFSLTWHTSGAIDMVRPKWTG